MRGPTDQPDFSPMTRPLLLGHRGARGVKSIPENTLASFDRALAVGCDGFEFDVRLTGDEEAVVCHDPKIGRLEVARAKAKELTSLPQFNDILERYRQSFLNIELKVPGLEKIVIARLREFGTTRFMISSFLPDVLRVLHAADSSLPLGIICEKKRQLEQWRELPVGYVIPHYHIAGPELIEELRAAGKQIFVWTVNSAVTIRRFAEWGVDGMISDYPKRLVESFR
jgi:glycerophosphoryl diester phosphodiesterase